MQIVCKGAENKGTMVIVNSFENNSSFEHTLIQ